MNNILKTSIFLIVSLFLFQGFQCASKEFTSARTALKKGDTTSAITYLKEELIKNPTNAEAKLLLTDVTFQTAISKEMTPQGPKESISSISQLREAAKMSVDTYKEVKTPADLNYIKSIQQKIWVMAFNEGISYLNEAPSGQNSPEIDSAIALWDVGMIVRPKNPTFLSLKSTAYAKAGLLDMERQVSSEYVDLIVDNSMYFLDKGLYLDMPASDIGVKIGSLEETKYDTTSRGNKEYLKRTDIYQEGTTKSYIYSGKGESDTDFVIKGWLYDAPEYYLLNDLNWQEMNLSPLIEIAQRAYEEESYDVAIENLDKLLMFIPTDRQVNQLKIQSYVNKGSGDVAVAELESLISKDPNKKEYYLQLGDLYSEMGKYEEATEAYEAAIKLDPNFDYALRNLASVYKNRAAVIQKVELEKKEADDNYQPQTELYFPLLEKSAEYFKKSTETETFKTDYDTYVELYNIYDVMEKADKKKEAIKGLENIESQIPQNRKASYYYKMLRIYSDEKMNDEVDRISKIINDNNY